MTGSPFVERMRPAMAEGLRRHCPTARDTLWLLVLALGAAISAPSVARAAEPFVLSTPRFEPEPPEAYGRLTLQVGFTGAAAPVVRLWSRMAREGQEVALTAIAIQPPVQAPSGGLRRWWEMGEPGSRRLTLVAEDAQGNRSAPLDLTLQVEEPPGRFEELTYLSKGLKIKGYLYRPPGPGPAPAIIYSHGSVRRGQLVEPRRYEWRAYRLARLGYAVLVAERRGYGGSEGEGVIGGEGNPNSLRYGLPGEVQDVLSAIAYLKGRPEIDATRIALLGKSLGGLVSLLAAAERPDLRGAISLAGGYGFGDRTMGPTMLFVQNELRGAARRLRVPTLLMHAQNDRTVPLDFSRMVYEELRQRDVTAAIEVYPPFKVAGKELDGHALFDGVKGLPYFWGDLSNFLAEALKP